MARVLVILLAAAALIGAAVLARARRRKREVPELNQHPERLDQMLDETDDA